MWFVSNQQDRHVQLCTAHSTYMLPQTKRRSVCATLSSSVTSRFCLFYPPQTSAYRKVQASQFKSRLDSTFTFSITSTVYNMTTIHIVIIPVFCKHSIRQYFADFQFFKALLTRYLLQLWPSSLCRIIYVQNLFKYTGKTAPLKLSTMIPTGRL